MVAYYQAEVGNEIGYARGPANFSPQDNYQPCLSPPQSVKCIGYRHRQGRGFVTDDGTYCKGGQSSVWWKKIHRFAHTLNLADISAIGLNQQTEGDPLPEVEDSDDDKSDSNDLPSTAPTVEGDRRALGAHGRAGKAVAPPW